MISVSSRKISLVGTGREMAVLMLPRSFTWCPIAQLLVAVLEKKMVWIHRMTSWVKNWLNCCAERTIVSSSKPSLSHILYVSLSYSSELILRSILFNILISGLHDEGNYTFSMSWMEDSFYIEELSAIEKVFNWLENRQKKITSISIALYIGQNNTI